MLRPPPPPLPMRDWRVTVTSISAMSDETSPRSASRPWAQLVHTWARSATREPHRSQVVAFTVPPKVVRVVVLRAGAPSPESTGAPACGLGVGVTDQRQGGLREVVEGEQAAVLGVLQVEASVNEREAKLVVELPRGRAQELGDDHPQGHL
ncbi:MAG: hypothetical protein JWQ95_6017 [Sphaerisporangium sp.]|nr:hypothetical protein [Sphaerisporangium sp.]